MTTAVEALLTADEFSRLPEGRKPHELVRGKVVTMNVPAPRHGQICAAVARIVGVYAHENHLGHVLSNDSAVVTERSPDTVRGADISFYSYRLIPPGPLPKGYLSVLPELVFEVRSPTDRWSRLLGKVSEYLDAGVLVACVLDQVTESIHVFRQEELPEKLRRDDEFTVPEILGDFRVRVALFFE